MPAPTVATRKKTLTAPPAAPPTPAGDQLADSLRADSIASASTQRKDSLAGAPSSLGEAAYISSMGQAPAEEAVYTSSMGQAPAEEVYTSSMGQAPAESAAPAASTVAPPPPVASPVQEAAPVAPPAPAHQHDPFGLGAGKLVTSPLLEKYRGEHVGLESKAAKLPTAFNIPSVGEVQTPTTAYAPDAAHHAAPIHDGRIHFGGAGKPADAPADSGENKRAWAKDKDQRFNYAMDPAGGLKLSDPHAETIAGVTPDGQGHKGQRVNHSTMVAGGDVAGAGTMKVAGGKVESLSDSSGHYQPKVTQTAQVARTLADQGVLAPERTNIELTKKGYAKDLNLSATELLAYEGDPTRAWGRGKGAAPLEPGPKKLRQHHDPPSEARQKLDQKLGARGGGMWDEAPTSFATAREKHAQTGDAAHLAAPEDTIRREHQKKDKALRQVKAFDSSKLNPIAPPAALVEGRARSKRVYSRGRPEDEPG